MRLGQHSTLNVEAIPTGSLSLDIALGIGGVPKGRIHRDTVDRKAAVRPPVALHTVAECQKRWRFGCVHRCRARPGPPGTLPRRNWAWILTRCSVSEPDTGEQALEIAEALVRSGAVDIVVVDSVAAMVTKAEIEGEMGDSHVGVQARLMSQGAAQAGRRHRQIQLCCHLRRPAASKKSGVMYGNPEKPLPGGRALKFYSSVRLDVRRIEQLKSGAK